MLKTKLKALDHPTPDSLDINDRKAFASTVLWLEDQKIRQYKIEDREPLRQIGQLADWEKAYLKYKADLGMPNFHTPLEEISWLLSFAVRLEFLDAPEKYKHINVETVNEQKNKSATPKIKAQNVFDNMDFNNKDFIAGIKLLATKLKVPHHPNHLIQLEAISRVVHDRLCSTVKPGTYTADIPFPFEKGDDVIVRDDPNLDYPARVLRLLQIQSLRELQTRINETIVSIQNLTANPKTDTKLGKVGR